MDNFFTAPVTRQRVAVMYANLWAFEGRSACKTQYILGATPQRDGDVSGVMICEDNLDPSVYQHFKGKLPGVFEVEMATEVRKDKPTLVLKSVVSHVGDLNFQVTGGTPSPEPRGNGSKTAAAVA